MGKTKPKRKKRKRSQWPASLAVEAPTGDVPRPTSRGRQMAVRSASAR